MHELSIATLGESYNQWAIQDLNITRNRLKNMHYVLKAVQNPVQFQLLRLPRWIWN